jgi:predicted Zn-dependent protease
MGTRYSDGIARNERVELSFLEGVRRRCPGNRLILEALGELYTKVGRYDDGLKIDIELTRLCPRESMAWYNLACSYALVGRKDDAFDALSRAVELGYADPAWMCRDHDLESLRDDPRFKTLVKRATLS